MAEYTHQPVDQHGGSRERHGDPIERHCDVAIVGGSAAGLAAALQLSRQQRDVIVIDGGEPRNAVASHMHGYLGHDGRPPSEFLAIGRAEVRRYGAQVLSGRVVDIERSGEVQFRVRVAGGGAIRARRVVMATGIVDVLPDIEGLHQHWGRRVIHCPFCHGYEFRDQRIVQVLTDPAGLHSAMLFRQLSDRYTIIAHPGVHGDEPSLEELRRAGVPIVQDRVQRLVNDAQGELVAVELGDGSLIEADAVVVTARFEPRIESFQSIGIKAIPHPVGLGSYVETNASGETSVPGVYAVGNVTDPSQQMLHAAASGAWVGGMISASLAQEDLARMSRNSPTVAEWDARYSAAPIWSGNPNGALLAEIDGLEPRRALDVGAGEGADAIWLAQAGWEVTATDVSAQALARITALAAAHAVPIECVPADIGRVDPFAGETFDLVTALYVPIARTPDDRGLQNLIDAVAPGGTLLVVSHDREPMRARPGSRGSMFDPDAFVSPSDIAAQLARSDEWVIEAHETRPRPLGSATAHVDDVVLRARRRAQYIGARVSPPPDCGSGVL